VVIENVRPAIEAGLGAKASLGAPFVVRADVFGDGHDLVAAALHYRTAVAEPWTEMPMRPLGNDRWEAAIEPKRLGHLEYEIIGWSDHYETWRDGTAKKVEAGLDVSVELEEGARLLTDAADRAASDGDRTVLKEAAGRLRSGATTPVLDDVAVSAAMWRSADRRPLATTPHPYHAFVEPERARFSAWYEMFPRSTVDGTDRHATLRDVIDRIPYVAAMGFDVLYLPPIHPIGRTERKGPNNTPAAGGPEDVGSPWAIGAPEGGHTAVHPDLGTLDDVRALVAAAGERGLAVALDLAFQCSPDHPWVEEHPSWFKHRSDGTIQYAENPPKKYQDIYPLDFETDDWQDLWKGLLEVVIHWIEAGITIFRVDNPHTKAFAFWEWLIAEVKVRHPDVLMLAEAFTRPRVMEQLAKIGFSQSYTYFTWRPGGRELREYLTELTTETIDYMRPNAWPNTPDILTEQLQEGGRPAFANRAILAATLFPNWGVYGPAFELVEHTAVRAGSEEYLDSEKYQLRSWDLDQPHTLAPLLTRLNAVRRAHPALQHLGGLHFHGTSSDQLLCYSKLSPDCGDRVLVVVNLDPTSPQQGMVDVDWARLDLPYNATYLLDDVLGDGSYLWHGSHNWVGLDPHGLAAHVFHVRGSVP
jgi:starch synthase (maltosyl-transferring)